jgi:hypothetical protein
VTPDTILWWSRRLIAQKWTSEYRRPGRPGLMKEIASLIVRMATENPAWGYSRIQGALKSVDHRVAKYSRQGPEGQWDPAPGRPSSWRAFLRAHWGAIAAADFFTTEVWTSRWLVTYYTLFVLDLKSRQVLLSSCSATWGRARRRSWPRMATRIQPWRRSAFTWRTTAMWLQTRRSSPRDRRASCASTAAPLEVHDDVAGRSARS